MVFNDQLIKELGEQIVTPFNPDNVSAASIDLTLGDTIVIENGTKLSIKEDFGGMYVVEPDEFLLMTTAETVHIPNYALAIVKGKSSRAREGLAIEFANLIDPGFFGPITLEVKNMNQERSIILEPGMKIAQMYFMRLTGPAEHPYSADHHHYQGQGPATDSWQRDKYTAVEEWKPIRKYKGFYEVSNLGRVRSLPRDTKFGQQRKFVKGQILKPIENNGYLYACLSKHNKTTRYAIHRLVADAFIPNYDNLPQVNHRDENKANNRVENLEWCTADYNNRYSDIYKKGAEAARIPVVQYTKDGRKIAEYSSMLQASESTGISVTSISACVRNKRQKDGKGCYYTTRSAGGFYMERKEGEQMSYPFDGITYLEKIQNDPDFLSEVDTAYYILINKKCQDEHRDVIELSLEEQFSVLGEAFKLCGNGIYINDDYSHFMQDVLDCLLKRKYSPWADKEKR